jgi:ABC-type transporter Mla MlaB component
MSAQPAKSVAFAISGRITREDVPALCDRACTLVRESGADTVECDVRGAGCDAVTVDALARLQLTARRSGFRMELRGACPTLVALLDFMGLSEVLANAAGAMSFVRDTGPTHDPRHEEEKRWPASNE